MGDSRTNHDDGGISDLQLFINTYPTIDFFRCQWIDYSGTPMVRVITKQYAQSLESKKTAISLPPGVLGGCILDGSLFFEVLDLGEDRLWPDWKTLKICHYAPGHASVMLVFDSPVSTTKFPNYEY